MRFHWWGTCLPAVLELSISTWIFARLHLYLLYSYVPPPLPAAAQHTQDTTDEMQHNAQDFAAGIAALNQKQKKGGGFLGGLLS